MASTARYWSSVSRLPVTVRHQPQSFEVNDRMRGTLIAPWPRRASTRAVVLGERMLGEQDQRVEHVLAVDLDDLELRQEELGERQRRRRLGQPVAELEAMAHLEAVHEHVDRPVAGHVDEVGLLAAEQGVVPLVRRVALAREELVEGAAVLAARREVEVDLDPPGPRRPVRGVGPDRHPAHQPDEQTPLSARSTTRRASASGSWSVRGVAGIAGVSGHRPPSRRAAGRDPVPDGQRV